MLILKNAGHEIGRYAPGATIQLDGIYVSPAQDGWSHGDYTLTAAPYVPPPEPDPPTEGELLAYAANLRWQREIGGVMVDGVDVATDDRSKLMLSGARIAAMSDPAYSTRWKTSAGWVDLTAAQVIAISDAVQAHVADCFATEAAVADQIEAGTVTTYAEIDAAFTSEGATQ